MKYLIYGNDTEARKKEVTAVVGDLFKKGFESVSFSDVDFSENDFLANIGGQDLFGQKKVLVMTHCLSTKNVRDFLESKKGEIENTETPMVFVESDFLKKDFPSFKKVFTKISEHKKAKEVGQKRYNVFPLIDAIVSKNKKSSWLLFQEATDEGVTSEEIINLLFWQLKTLTLVSGGGSAKDLGMKPFVYNKSKKLLSKYSVKELREKMFTLIKMFQESRFEKDGEERFEKFLLS